MSHLKRGGAVLALLLLGLAAAARQQAQRASPTPAAQPDLAAQVRVFRDGEAVVNTPLRPLSVQGVPGLVRIPRTGSFPLQTLSSGRNLPQITAADRTGQRTATTRTVFTVE